MKESFPIKHWFLTLVIGPFFTPLYNYLFIPYENLNSGLLELYPIALLLSVVLSLPVLGLFYLLFQLLNTRRINPKTSKSILIAFAILSIIVTVAFMKGSQSKEIGFTYSLAALFSGLFLPIKKRSPESNIIVEAT